MQENVSNLSLHSHTCKNGMCSNMNEYSVQYMYVFNFIPLKPYFEWFAGAISNI